jgi:hypothetical protein
MPKAWFIDAANRDIRMVEADGLADLQALVGGDITVATIWPGDNPMYVNDEGAYSPPGGFFAVAGYPHPLIGNGVITGPDVYDDEGEQVADTTVNMDELQRRIRFMYRTEVDQWAQQHADEPAVVVEGKVLVTMGEMFAGVPRVH